MNKHLKNSLKILLVYLLLIPFSGWSKPPYYFQNVMLNHHVSNNGIRTICEDENGFIWFGGPNGLFFHNTITLSKIELNENGVGVTKPINVNKIYKDRQKDIWICTDDDLVKYHSSKGNFEYKKIKLPNTVNEPSSLLPSSIKSIAQINHQEYLILRDETIFRYDENMNLIKLYKPEFNDSVISLQTDNRGNVFIIKADGGVYEFFNNTMDFRLLYPSPISPVKSICKDGNKYYLGYDNVGVIIINSKGEEIDQLISPPVENGLQIKNFIIRHIIKHPDGSVWVGTNKGIFISDKGQVTFFDSYFESGIPHRNTYCLHNGADGRVWVGTYGRGLALYSKFNYQFKHIGLNYAKKDMGALYISSICEDNRSNLWIGCEDDGGIFVYSQKNEKFVDNGFKKTLRDLKNIRAICNVGDNKIALGQSNSNIITQYNYIEDKIVNRIKLPIPDQPGVRGIHYVNNLLWVHTPNQILAYDLKNKKVITIVDSEYWCWKIYYDSSFNLWVCTTKGLYVLKPGMNKLEPCQSIGNLQAVKDLSIYSICEDKDGTLWLGTMGHGVYMYYPESKKLTLVPNHQLSSEADIYNIVKDNNDDMWYIANEGIFQYINKDQSTLFHGTNNGTINAQFRNKSGIVGSSGNLFLVTDKGFLIIDPSIIERNNQPPTIFLSDFKVNNNNYQINNTNKLHVTEQRFAKKIRLKHYENTLSFRAVNNDFIKSERNQFKYRLKNYDENWRQLTQGTELTFTKIPPGNYTLEVQGANSNSVWSRQPFKMDIRIQAPLYYRWYSILFYLLFVASIGFWLYNNIKTKLKLRKEIDEALNRSRVNELIHTERIKLFTNISHELRTPLSLIISPIKHILDKEDINPKTQHLLEVVNRNIIRLQKTTDQTIDFRLLEIGKLKPHFEKHDIIKLAKDVYGCFEQQFVDKQINNTFISDFKSLEVKIDGDMIEKIIYNLLSNALKYTPENENILLRIKEEMLTLKDIEDSITTGILFEGAAVGITVKDTGSGITQDLLPHIFERFTKGNQPHQSSTGIGLNLCSEYATMNQSFIQLKTKDGVGTRFTLYIPLKDNYKLEKSDLNELLLLNNSDLENKNEERVNDSSRAATILLVEDHGELRDYLKSFLSIHYKVITAKNGSQAIAQVEHVKPDIILTDVSMPGIDGIELTKRLKQDKKHHHIPIIVMTAYAERNSQMLSVVNGANSFLTKPIDQALLLAQIENILKQEQKTISDDVNIKIIKTKESFIDEAERIVEENLQNSNFQIADLHQSLNISKATLSRKLVAETGLNASGFIREVRLKNAKKLLLDQNFNIDEIASFVGFNNTSYFLKSFKKKYGVTPREYRRQAQGN